jgi:hypothetical protein
MRLHDNTGGYNKLTRAAAAGKVQDPFRGWNTLVSNGIEIWNLCPELRGSLSKDAAKKAATEFASSVPL